MPETTDMSDLESEESTEQRRKQKREGKKNINTRSHA